MTLEFRPDKHFNYIKTFAGKFNIPCTDTFLLIPAEIGEGSICKVNFSDEFTVLLHHYKLKEELVLKRFAPENRIDRVSMLFYRSTFPKETYFSHQERAGFKGPEINHSTIEISSNDLNSVVRFPAKSDIHFTVVGISSRLLYEYFYSVQENKIIQNIINGTDKSFLYHEIMWTEIEQVLEHIAMIDFNEVLGKFYFKLKVQELLYHLFDKLLRRDSVTQQRIGNDDATKIHTIKNEILKDFSKPPVLAQLSRKHGISQTKMKSLFKQIYGDTIYNHFQKARMYEAVMLLKNTNLTISQISDRLGFSTLSHFSRLFKKHYKQSPKKFTSVA